MVTRFLVDLVMIAMAENSPPQQNEMQATMRRISSRLLFAAVFGCLHLSCAKLHPSLGAYTASTVKLEKSEALLVLREAVTKDRIFVTSSFNGKTKVSEYKISSFIEAMKDESKIKAKCMIYEDLPADISSLTQIIDSTTNQAINAACGYKVGQILGEGLLSGLETLVEEGIEPPKVVFISPPKNLLNVPFNLMTEYKGRRISNGGSSLVFRLLPQDDSSRAIARSTGLKSNSSPVDSSSSPPTSLLFLGSSTFKNKFSALPQVTNENSFLKGHFSNAFFELYESEFLSENLQVENSKGELKSRIEIALKNATAIHFATHGLNDDDDEQTASAGAAKVGLVDFNGELISHEAALAFLERAESVRFVNLSSCFGASSRRSLPSLALKVHLSTGAPVLGSLWNLDDAVANKFVQSFYGEWTSTKNLNSAFSNALKALKTPEAPSGSGKVLPVHPFFWASFTIVQPRVCTFAIPPLSFS
ncbi:MAG: CHAT domain-containing protein [Silvanigrellales bacterium]|nr:CHAT domain-containing protein [Silvanigrellales bacterium]